MNVEYKPIPGYPGYRAGDDGTIWSCLKRTGSAYYGDSRYIETDNWKRLSPQLNKETGRARYTLRHESGLLDQLQAAYCVLISFVGPRPPGMLALHKNGDCTNDALNNLYWGTHQDNCLDAIRHGTQTYTYGENHHNAILSDEDVEEIRLRRKQGETQISIAQDFGVSREHVRDITNGKYR